MDGYVKHLMDALICLLRLGFLIEQRVHGGVVNHIAEPTMNAKQTAVDAAAIHTKPGRLSNFLTPFWS